MHSTAVGTHSSTVFVRGCDDHAPDDDLVFRENFLAALVLLRPSANPCCRCSRKGNVLLHLVRPIGPFYFRFPPGLVCCTAAASVGVQTCMRWHYHSPAIVGVHTICQLRWRYHSSLPSPLSCLTSGCWVVVDRRDGNSFLRYLQDKRKKDGAG